MRPFLAAALATMWLAGPDPVRLAAGPAATGQRTVDAGDLAIPIIPTRRAADEPPPPPPALPRGAEQVAPLTLDLRLDRPAADSRPRSVRQTITRTADRIHLVAAEGPEWLFERNPVDPRRVSGSLIQHPSRAIVFYSDSDLRNMLGISGWAHVLALGFDHRLLADLESSDDTRTIGGLRFVRFFGRSQATGRLEVWWNDQAIVPGELRMSSGSTSTRMSIERVRTTVDRDLLRPPASRFPSYESIELADWLEHR